MRRREFIKLIGGAAASRPLAARAQQQSLPVVGILSAQSQVSEAALLAEWEKGLNDTGYIGGRNVLFEYRFADGHGDRLAMLAADLVRRQVAVLVANTTPPALAAKAATTTIPIVFMTGVDPVEVGLVTSFNRPGANVTGTSLQTLDLAGKRFELFRETIPNVRRLAIMADASFPQAMLELGAVKDLARKFSIEVIPLEIRGTEDIAPAFDKLKTEKTDALYVVINELLNANRLRIVTSAQTAKLPTIFGTRDWVLSGGLMSYGPNFPALFGRAAEITDRILRGTKPGDIPVEQPTKFELVINLKTAKALDLPVPKGLLALADDVIE